MSLWLYVPEGGPRRDYGRRLLARKFHEEEEEDEGDGESGCEGVYNEAYMPPTQINRWVSPACSVGIMSASISCGLLFVV